MPTSLLQSKLRTSALPIFVVSIAAILALFAVLNVGGNVVGQSGRRVAKTKPAPVPVPQETPAAQKPAVKPGPALTFVIGMERPDYFVTPRATTSGTVLLSFTDRLQDHPSVKVEHVRADMTRGEAVQRARTEKVAYVVLLKLCADSMRGSRDDSQISIQYSVYAPVTAKVKTSGQTYPQSFRRKPVILDPRSPGIYGDYQMQQAAREAAERVLDVFKLSAPTRRLLVQKD